MAAKLKEAVKSDGILKDKAVRATLSTLAAEMKKRIHTEGKKSDGSKIGKYSNPYLRKRSKFNRTDGSDVVISLTRQLEADWSIVAENPIKNANGYGLGFKNNAQYKSQGKAKGKKASKKDSTSGKTISVSNADKAEWMTKLYGDIWIPTKTEKENIIKNYSAYVTSLVRNLNKR